MFLEKFRDNSKKNLNSDLSNSNHTSGKFYSYKSEQFKEIRSDFLD